MKVFVISKYVRMAWMGQVLRAAGIRSELVLIDASMLPHEIKSGEDALVLIDPRSAPFWETTPQACAAPQLRFVVLATNMRVWRQPGHNIAYNEIEQLAAVLSAGSHGPRSAYSRKVKPDLVRAAMECGFDGVLSTRLPVGEAAGMLRQICFGERPVCLESTACRELPAPQPPGSDFDAFWMFGTGPGDLRKESWEVK